MHTADMDHPWQWVPQNSCNCQPVQVKCQAIIAVSPYLSVGSTWTYLELPATNVTTARSMAAAGMAKPMVQLTLSWMYTKVVTARKEPRLMAK